MCRFLAYRGVPIVMSKLLQEPKNSLVNQSLNSRERSSPTNGDGYGVGWYTQSVSAEPALLRSIRPAWNDRNLLSIAPKIESDCILAHIRAATRGEVSELNCHPFQYKNLLMMHNGTVRGFRRLKRQIRQSLPNYAYNWVEGQTDSEHLFGLFLAELGEDDDPGIDKAKIAIRGAIEKIEGWKIENNISDPLTLNTAITNGKWVLSTKYVTPETSRVPISLYYSEGAKYECEDGSCVMLHENIDDQAVLIVSEKLSDIEDDWIPVPKNFFVAIREDLTVDLEPILAE